MRGWLKELRESKGMSNKAAADALGLSEAYYWRIENGERQKNLELELAKKICDVFGCELSYIEKHEIA